ncbi:MAG: S41 family peptidase [Erysipelotrichaceae bacterium]|jgi:carboxyl-terminal processing protease|nr:S41 family peptidase [Erysipelotrichaceae bacterium]
MEEKKIIKYKLVRHKWPDEIAAEKRVRRRKIMTAASLVVCFLMGYFASCIVPPFAKTMPDSNMEKLESIYDIMTKKWYFGKDIDDLDNVLMTSAIDGMVNSGGDIHTAYMDADQAASFMSSLEGNFVGIGVQYYAINDSTFIIERVFKDSPAEAAGMMQGDQIYSINKELCDGMTIDEVADKIKGDAGTSVSLEILREGKVIPLDIIRGEVKSSVYGEIKEEVGILEITSFAETSGEEVGKYVKEFKQKGIKRLIIDLRDNSGGYLKAAREIASYFLPEGTVIFKELHRNGVYNEYTSLGSAEGYSFDKIVILVNHNSASASEVLTMALKEQLQAVVVGVNSYGKGTVQTTLPFADGSSIKYTMAEWTSPNEVRINGIGIQPDYEVELDPAITMGAPGLEEEERYQEDTVSLAAKSVQTYLKFLGYDVDRTDMYFSLASAQALRKYQSDNGMEVTGVIDADIVSALLSSCSVKWHREQDTLDLQMIKAMEVIRAQ